MTTKSKSNTTTPSPDAATGVAAMTEAMLAANPAFTRVWSEIAAESARFMSQRLEADLKIQQRLLACTTPADLATLQAEFYQTAMAQYTEGAQRMADIMTQATGESLKGLKTGTARRYDDVPV